MLTALPLPDFLDFVHRLDTRAEALSAAGHTYRAIRVWRAADRLLLRRAMRAS